MDKKILAIFDSEEGYAYRLMDFLGRMENIPFEIHVFTRKDKFFTFAEKEDIQCLLISENAYQPVIEQLKIPHIIILSESGTNLNKALCHIYKYQSCENVVKEIMAYYTDQVKDADICLRTVHKKMRIIGIYTPVGRCLQTTFSLTLGQMLARHHKTLYLNFEAYSGLGRMLNREFKNDISDLIYYFNCTREKLFYRLESMVETVNGLDFIPPVDIYRSLTGIRGTQWIDLFGELEKVSEYEFLILDLSDVLMDLWEVLKNCDYIYTIAREDGLAMAKLEQYERMLESMDCREISLKTTKWKLPVFKQLPVSFDELTYGELSGYIKKEVLVQLLGEGSR